MNVHKSWKRIEILNCIDKLGLDIKEYSYLTKDLCREKFTDHIKLNNLTEYHYLFKVKPMKKMTLIMRSCLTKKAKKVSLYVGTLDLDMSGYQNILEVKDDIILIKNHQYIPCIRKAIELWNTIDEDFVPYIEKEIEYEMSLEQERKLQNKLNQLSVKRGQFIMDFS